VDTVTAERYPTQMGTKFVHQVATWRHAVACTSSELQRLTVAEPAVHSAAQFAAQSKQIAWPGLWPITGFACRAASPRSVRQGGTRSVCAYNAVTLNF
jgi:hypothetical protein